MYTADGIASAAIAEDYIDHIRIAKDQLRAGNQQVCLVILRCTEQLISNYLNELKSIGDMPTDKIIMN